MWQVEEDVIMEEESDGCNVADSDEGRRGHEPRNPGGL